jgi:hypothetical protein
VAEASSTSKWFSAASKATAKATGAAKATGSVVAMTTNVAGATITSTNLGAGGVRGRRQTRLRAAAMVGGAVAFAANF